MLAINFNRNWNGKLRNQCFTTIRLHNVSKYRIGEKYEIRLNEKPIGTATAKAIKTLSLNQLDDFTTCLDTGLDRNKTVEMIKGMYKNKVWNWETQKLDLILLEMDSPQMKLSF